MNDYLLPERLKKGETAGKRLLRLEWPAALHQKLINKRYNAKFKAVSPTPDTKLPKPADILIPILPPGEFKKEKKKMVSLFKAATTLKKYRETVEQNLIALIRVRKRDRAKVGEFKKAALAYKKEADEVLEKCKETADACPGADITRAAKMGSYLQLTREADELEKTLDRSEEDYATVLKAVGKTIRKVKRDEEYMIGEVLTTSKFVLGMTIVMP